MSHTPGPWKVDDSHLVFASVLGEYVANTLVEEHLDLVPREQVEANARLISAAPDLLAALEDAIECGLVPKSSALEGGALRYSSQVKCADKIRAAIAKAKGEA